MYIDRYKYVVNYDSMKIFGEKSLEKKKKISQVMSLIVSVTFSTCI